MGSAVAQLLPLAIGAALSSVPISATLLILLSPKRERSALPFLLGWVGGMVVLVVVAGLGAVALPTPQVRAGVGVSVAEIVVGLGLVCYGLIAALRAIRHPRLSSTNRWLDAVGSFGPRSAFGLAVALNFRPKGLLLTIAAGVALAGASVSWPDASILLAGYLVLAVSTVVAPIVVTLAAPGRTEPKLMAARDWLERNGSIVTAVVMGIVGVFIALSGLTKLF